MKYSIKQFVDAQPAWKRKRDSILTRYLYRPVSFVISCFCANLGISANSVSRFSIIFGVMTSAVYLIPNRIAGLIASCMVIIWIIIDCVDGNLARTVKAMPFGEFLDATGGYLINGLLFSALGLRAFFEVESPFYSNPYIVFLGAIASSADSLSRLIYQKYVNSCYEQGINGKVEHDGSNSSRIDKIRIWIDMNIGIGGVLPILLLVTSIVGEVWIIVVCYAVYGMIMLAGTSLYLIRKTYDRGMS